MGGYFVIHTASFLSRKQTEKLNKEKSVENLIPGKIQTNTGLDGIHSYVYPIIKMHLPSISVILPVYNMESFIFQAVDSILKQTFESFELIIIDDASIDNTRIILDGFEDSRIIRIYNPYHTGNYRCRNQGLDIAKGKYIAVMDGDDIAHSDRLRKQHTFMESNPRYMAVGTDIEFFSESSPSCVLQRTRDEALLKVQLLKDNVCTHPTLIIRQEIFNKYGIKYNEDYEYSADYDLMVNISRIGAISNLPEVLLSYRRHPGQISHAKRQAQWVYADQIRLKQLEAFKIRPSIDEIILHLSLMKGFAIPASKHLSAVKWCNKLLTKNDMLKLYDEKFLYRFLEESCCLCMKI